MLTRRDARRFSLPPPRPLRGTADPLVAVVLLDDEGTLSEVMWSKAEVYDSEEKLKQTQWATHYTYVKSKVSPGPDHWP